MSGLIWLVVVIWIISRFVKSTKKNDKEKQQQTSTRQPAQRQNTRPYTQPDRQQRTQHGHAKHTKPQAAAQPSILQKAKENAARQFDDDTNPANTPTQLGQLPAGDEIVKDKGLARHEHSEHTPGHESDLHNQTGVDDFDTYHLMDEVYDLIVMGYSGHLEYERDFVAEGMDMLTRMCG